MGQLITNYILSSCTFHSDLYIDRPIESESKNFIDIHP